MFALKLSGGTFHEGDAELGAEPTFALASLRAIDRASPHPIALPGVFGDGVLLERLAPYRRMREHLLATGIRFVPSEETSTAERMAPELRLLDALRERRVTFARTAIGVDEMLAARPHARFDDFGLVRICLPNNTPHEGAHVMVYELARAAEGELEGRRLVEALVAGEGFAMAFELWLALHLAHERRRSVPVFFGLNAAQNPFSLRAVEEERRGALLRLGDLARDKPWETMRIVAAAGLIANVRPQARALRDGLVEHLLDYARFPKESAPEGRLLVRMALGLDDTFKNVTARTFFRYCDLEAAYDELCALPLEHHFRAGSVAHDHVATAITTMEGP